MNARFPAVRLSSLLCLLALPLTASADPAPAAPASRPFVFRQSPIDPASAQTKPWNMKPFLARQEAILARVKAGPVGVAFLGDSITERWSLAPDIWRNAFATFDPANLGASGDLTQHTVWRIEHGALDGIHPRVVVLMIGTNNTAGHTASQIVAGIRRIVDLIHAKVPEAKLLLLAIFPRGVRANENGIYDDGVLRMQTIRAVNAELATWDNGRTLRYLDIGARFLGPDGHVREDLLPDHLHPNGAGYRVWADAMLPLLREMYADAASAKSLHS